MKTQGQQVHRIGSIVGVCVIALIAALTWQRPAFAHHAFAGVFDVDRPVELSGIVTSVEWMNPHVWVHIDVASDNGQTESWGFELGSVNHLFRLGWDRDALNAGDEVTIAGVRARDDSLRAAVRTITLPNGEQLFGGQNESR